MTSDSPPAAARSQSDTGFFVILGTIGGVYVVLIVGMLLADAAYLASSDNRKEVRLNFSRDDSGRALQAGEKISNQFDRYGLGVRSGEGQACRAAIAPDQLSKDDEEAAGKEFRPATSKLLVVGSADQPRIEPGVLQFFWRDPVRFEELRLAVGSEPQTVTVRAFAASGETLREVELELEADDSHQVELLVEGVSRLEFELARGVGVDALRFLWKGRPLTRWEREHPVLSKLTHNAVTEAFAKPELQYSIWLSLISCTITAILSLWTAVPIGYLLSRFRFWGRDLLDAILDIPIVLPPLVVGLSLLILFQFAPRFVREAVIYEIPAVILAQYMVACAFAVRTMRATFDLIDVRREQVAMTLGCSRFQAFGLVVLPEASRGMLTAGTLAWARSLGEFGPLLIFAGATRNKTEVLSTTVFLELSIGDLSAAVVVSMIMVFAAVLVLVVARVWGTRSLTI